EGSYSGKGMYDVDACEAALAGRVPETALLSHDLFEGVFARAGAVTDIELFGRAQSRYGVAAARQHRWARGDWQLLPWIVGYGSHLPIPLIGRWKMVDNLRRTLSAPAAFLTLVVGWTLPASSPVVWTAFVLATIALPTLVPILTVVIPGNRGISKPSHARPTGRDPALPASPLPLLLLWAASPAVARWISLPRLTARTTPLSSGDARALRLIARRTWRFFATFVGPEEHALPPDNFQEEPNPVVAHRTSPTNLGLYLLSTVAAHDFGWLGMLDVVERLEATLAAMTGLERFRGHFYNWYDTKDRRPLDPNSVSSVDSGNLAGHLIALAHGWRAV